MELYVIDIKDAFWHLPLHTAERKKFAVFFRNRYYAFLRAAQASWGGPLTWAALASLVSRLTQPLFEAPVELEGVKQFLRSQIYVDDPVSR